MLRALAACLAFVAAAVAPARADTFTLEFDGRAFALAPIGKVRFNLTLSDGAYDVAAGMRAGGVLALFQSQSFAASARGAIIDGDAVWQGYAIEQQIDKKRRQTEMRAGADGPSVTMDPMFKVWGDPPASDEQKRAGRDPLSSIMKMGMDVQRARACSGIYPVFDGRYYYVLSLAEAGGVTDFEDSGYKGPILRCALLYEPIAGYDLRQQKKKRTRAGAGEIWFALAKESVVAPPVRIVFPTPAGKAALSLSAYRRISVDVDSESAPAAAAGDPQGAGGR